ncbi:MAG: biotin--[acetyl-CoA-carboxylase] ligase [Bacteroidales bacterium]|nr:biotin--[acetyl-CoA-carboxylase] ligase [Bacteroidales bacterium]
MIFPYPVIELDETSSTNEYLRSLFQKNILAEGTTVTAEFQTKGRGQMGNSWESEPGKNLLFSTFLQPGNVLVNEQFIISQIVALSLQEMLEQYIAPVFIKWPNDIYYEERKIAGILIENDICGKKILASVIGIGLNVNQEVFCSDAPNPVSLRQLLRREIDKKELLSAFLSRLLANYALLKEGKENQIRESYRNALFRKEGFHPYVDKGGNIFNARISGIDNNGKLCLTMENGDSRQYYFKEISFLLS